MTYSELLQELNKLTPEQLAQDVTVYLSETDEFFAVVPDFPWCESDDSCDVLDAGHKYLVV